jgi:hypothetical protein
LPLSVSEEDVLTVMKDKMTMKVFGNKKKATEVYINCPGRNFTNCTSQEKLLE